MDAQIAGNLSFILTKPPANDNFADATEMRGSRWTAYGHNLGATKEPGETMLEWFFNPPNTNYRSVWWKWTAPVSGTITVDTLGSQMYNVLAVFTGDRVDALNPVTPVPTDPGNPFNGDASVRARSGTMRVTFDAVEGTTYYIAVQGAGFIVPSSGPITVTLSGPPAIPFAPDSFTAMRINSNSVELLWEDIAVDEEFYQIERSSDGISWELLTETTPDATRFIDLTAPAGTALPHYRIRAVNSVGASQWVTAESIQPTAQQQWLIQHFGTARASGNASWNADPDGDGIANLIEYALNGHPLVADSAVLPIATSVEEDGILYPAYWIEKNPAAADLQYRVQFSHDLRFWQDAEAAMEIVSDTDEVLLIRAIEPLTDFPQIYFRLLVAPH
ncbi:MAG: fibronectin type III domain-containing protein [Verrucomicrobia bacterium]|nr:fibronectin type III domain-containing protein [Verrucomicrobiota bacterium]